MTTRLNRLLEEIRGASGINEARAGKGRLDAKTNRDGSVTYWSVYDQVWARAYTQAQIPDQEWAARDEKERKLFRSLPKH